MLPLSATHVCHLRMKNAERVRCHSETRENGILEPKRIKETIKKPLGIVLAENKETGEVFIEEIQPEGNAAATTNLQVGDVLVSTSATVLKAGKDGEYEREGYGQRPYDNWETVEFDCVGQDFTTVMSAIASNNPRWGINTVTVTFERRKA